MPWKLEYERELETAVSILIDQDSIESPILSTNILPRNPTRDSVLETRFLADIYKSIFLCISSIQDHKKFKIYKQIS